MTAGEHLPYNHHKDATYEQYSFDEPDDELVGEILSREQVLKLMGASFLGGMGAFTGMGLFTDNADARRKHKGRRKKKQSTSSLTSSPSSSTCVVKPQQTEGPYFVDEGLNRSNIREDREGVPLDLTFNVSRLGSDSSCTSLAGVVVDVWHCDALGRYSDIQDTGQGFDTRGQKFLRGYQVTDANGSAHFGTIYPGWYQGRTVHVHFKIRTDPNSAQGYEFTSQLYFDDSITDQVHAQAPYSAKGQRTLRNSGDGIFLNGGATLLVPLSANGQGYAGTFDTALVVP